MGEYGEAGRGPRGSAEPSAVVRAVFRFAGRSGPSGPPGHLPIRDGEDFGSLSFLEEQVTDRTTYNAQLRRVAWPLRLAGLGLILLGAVVLGAWRSDSSLGPLGYALLGLGWGLFGYAAYVRYRWAKAHPYPEDQA